MMAVMTPLYAVSLGVEAQWLGLLMALPGIFPVIFALQVGRWIDAMGVARSFFFGIAGLLLSPLVVILFPGIGALAVSRLLLGFFVLVFTLASQSLVASLTNGRSHESNFGVQSTWLAGGRMVGPVVVGAIIDGAGYRVSFVAMFAIILVATLLAYRVAKAAPRVSGGRFRPSPLRKGAVSSTLRNAGLQMAVLTSAGVFMALTMREAFLPVMLEGMGMSATVIGSLVSLGSLTSVLIRPAMPVVIRLLGGAGNALVTSMVAVAVGIGLLSIAQSVAAFAVLAVVVGFGTGIAFPLSIVSVASHVPLRDRGVALSLRLSFNSTVEIFGPMLSGVVVAATSFRFGFATAGLTLGCITLVSLAILKRFNTGAIASEGVGSVERTEPHAELERGETVGVAEG